MEKITPNPLLCTKVTIAGDDVLTTDSVPSTLDFALSGPVGSRYPTVQYIKKEQPGTEVIDMLGQKVQLILTPRQIKSLQAGKSVALSFCTLKPVNS